MLRLNLCFPEMGNGIDGQGPRALAGWDKGGCFMEKKKFFWQKKKGVLPVPSLGLRDSGRSLECSLDCGQGGSGCWPRCPGGGVHHRRNFCLSHGQLPPGGCDSKRWVQCRGFLPWTGAPLFIL